VLIPAYATGSFDSSATATKIDVTMKATFALLVTDLTGNSTSCDPAMITVGRQPGESPAQVIHDVAQGESHVTVTNGTPGVDWLRLVVDGHQFQLNDLHDGETQTLNVSSAMR
jgi:hypothetical protein